MQTRIAHLWLVLTESPALWLHDTFDTMYHLPCIGKLPGRYDGLIACRLRENSSFCPAYPGAPAVQAKEGGSHLCPHPDPHQGAGRPGETAPEATSLAQQIVCNP